MRNKIQTINFLHERQIYLNNLSAVSKTTEEASVLISQLKSLHAEIELSSVETRVLKLKLSRIAIDLGLQPISNRFTK